MTQSGAPQSDRAQLRCMHSALRRHARCARAFGCVLAATPPFSLRKHASSRRYSQSGLSHPRAEVATRIINGQRAIRLRRASVINFVAWISATKRLRAILATPGRTQYQRDHDAFGGLRAVPLVSCAAGVLRCYGGLALGSLGIDAALAQLLRRCDLATHDRRTVIVTRAGSYSISPRCLFSSRLFQQTRITLLKTRLALAALLSESALRP
jgi:hypothetical protein